MKKRQKHIPNPTQAPKAQTPEPGASQPGQPRPARERPPSALATRSEAAQADASAPPGHSLPAGTALEHTPAAVPAPPPEAAQPSAGDTRTPGAEKPAGFPIIGIGASAGGLAALEALLSHMPADKDAGVAFVIVQHLDPDHKSMLSELVRRYTRMQVFDIEEGMKVEPNCTYIIPPNKDLALAGGKLRLTEPGMRRGLRLPIDFFFRSLARDRADQAIGIILSGNGTDGTLGLRTIKEAGGMAMVQEPESAEYDGMPRSAIACGLADYVLPPGEMPARLLAYVRRTSEFTTSPIEPVARDANSALLKTMALLRSHSGHDFSNYKLNTIRRRVERRMVVNQVESLDQYLRLLRHKPAELDTLFRELLIGVTSFFRDPPAFEGLRELALLPLVNERAPTQPLRVWVPACSTGEEAFSIAILIQETAEKLGRSIPSQIFATDIDHDSIEKARAGVYPANIAADVSPERLRRFFSPEEKDFYRVRKALRDQVVFAEQDIIKDPPFSKLDLISCRNMLIYMEPVLQKRLLPLFHYALASGGFLLLGNSESVGEFANLFGPVERKWKLYRRKDFNFGPVGNPTAPRFPVVAGERPLPGGLAHPKGRKPGLRELTERVLLRNFSPPCVAVNEEGEILYIHGHTGKYLELPPGEVSLNLVRVAREGLKVELANALRRVVGRSEPVHYRGLEVRTNGGFETVNITVERAEAGNGPSDIILVTFQELPAKALPKLASVLAVPTPPASTPPDEKDRRIADLERELYVKSETLQTTIEELETSNEELKSTNEELQSTNEELQSTNEEMETSKEELQSVNEEMGTINAELQQKVDGLSRANNDMNNLLAGTGIGVLFVDHQLHIQRFTPAITDIINLIQTDIGRPVSDLFPNLAGYHRLGQDVKAVLENLVPREAEVQTRSGRWYLMRILPYRTLENVIEGAVLTFVDISVQKSAEEKFRKLNAELEQRVEQRLAELERLNRDLLQEIERRQGVESRRLREIAALTRLHDLAAQLASQPDRQAELFQAAIDAGLEMAGAGLGLLHVYDPAAQSLRLAAQRGFEAPTLEHLRTVSAQAAAPAAQALRQRMRVMVEDITQNPGLSGSPTLPVLQGAGVRAAQSTPVLARDGRPLAVVSTYWTQPCHPDEGTLRLLDLLARQLTDLLENHGSKV